MNWLVRTTGTKRYFMVGKGVRWALTSDVDHAHRFAHQKDAQHFVSQREGSYEIIEVPAITAPRPDRAEKGARSNAPAR